MHQQWRLISTMIQHLELPAPRQRRPATSNAQSTTENLTPVFVQVFALTHMIHAYNLPMSSSLQNARLEKAKGNKARTPQTSMLDFISNK